MEEKLNSSTFIPTYRTSPNYFTRKRSFTFKSLSLFIIQSVQSSIQRELDRFFRDYDQKEVSEQFVTQSAFSQARLKIRPEAFVELNRDCIDHFYKESAYKPWNGHRLIGIDGSEVMLPKTKDTLEKFGQYTTNRMNGSIVLARISKAYDVLNNMNIDTKLVPKQIGEHLLAKGHVMNHFSKGDLGLFDRGYPFFDLFREILGVGANFCARSAIPNWKVAKHMVENKLTDVIAEITLGYELKKRYKEQGIEIAPILCRFICIELPTGGKEVLITSLLDSEKYPFEVFDELYHLRWGIE